MQTTAHPTEEHLIAYADGSLPSGLSVLVASHLTYCPACRARVARFETVGGALLAEEAVAGVAAPDRGAVFARIDALPEPRQAAAPAVAAGGGIFPAPLRAILGGDAESIRWRFLLPGLSEHRIAGFEGEDVSLLRARPGTKILAHTHEGEESTLVLAGMLRDGGRIYRAGDVAEADASHDHRPEIVGDETCICLVVLSGRMRFTGSVGRALNLLTH